MKKISNKYPKKFDQSKNSLYKKNLRYLQVYF